MKEMYQALLIVEIVEHIFLELRPLEIMVNIQRTCRFFKQVVSGSLCPQQALFLKPIGPLLIFDKAAAKFRHPKTNKTIFPRDHWLLTRSLYGHLDLSTPSMRYEGASWRRQLACQPALAEIECAVRGTVQPKGKGVTIFESKELTPHTYETEKGPVRVHFKGWEHNIISAWSSQETAREFVAEIERRLEVDGLRYVEEVVEEE